MKKIISLLAISAALAVGQTPSFVGHMVSCGDGYTIFRTFGGELIRTSDAIGCKEYTRYNMWVVYTEPGGAHPDRVMAIEPDISNFDFGTPRPTTVVVKRRWYQRLWR